MNILLIDKERLFKAIVIEDVRDHHQILLGGGEVLVAVGESFREISLLFRPSLQFNVILSDSVEETRTTGHLKNSLIKNPILF
eukprot:CAMPEP_0173159866 /NCGR_PEP_ID=MMETSP1105-20130129/17413_1 /TAXON_ID=2985 /ORGANISM="Ochromonas sp., Strain BG-1" /LENGTH=82 /DNA_ID=CAMNT_0014078479 /DNA_START=45 /DNA_END=291 /DNA_ORIENTATION=+